MAGYSTSNPPVKIADYLDGTGSVWLYKSVDADGTVNGAGYFTNAGDLGMQVGDIVLVIDTTTPMASFCFVASISSGAATTAFGAVA